MIAPKRFPISSKIFGLAIIMLLLFAVVACINYCYLNKVNRELKDIATHMVPLTAHITKVGVYSLEQQIHLEHVLYLYEKKQLNKKKIAKERLVFKARTRRVEQKFSALQQLSDQAIHYHFAREIDKIIAYARLEPYLNDLKHNFEEITAQALQIIRLLEQEKATEVGLLVAQLAQEEDDFSEKLEHVLTRFSKFIERSAIDVAEHGQYIVTLNIILSTVAAVIGISFSILLIIGLTRPLHKLLLGTQAVTEGYLNTKVTVNSRDEIGTLVTAFDKMVVGIQQKEQLKATFGQYVDSRIVDLLIETKKTGQVLGQQKTATVFFSDVANFSSISEWLTAKGLVKLINQYLTLASKPILRHHGIIDQFIGDAVVAFWTTPFANEKEQAVLACFSALEQFEQLQTFKLMMPELLGIRKGLPDFKIRMGLASSPVISGYFGSEHSKSYTVMGTATQTAEALETANKKYGTTILMSEATQVLAQNHIETRRIGRLILPNTHEVSNIYELLAKKGNLPKTLNALRKTFEQGLVAYECKNWEQAKVSFEHCQEIKPNDPPSHYYLTKIASKKQSSLEC